MTTKVPNGVRAFDTRYDMYELLKDIPSCRKGTIFYLDPDDSIKGSLSAGCLKLAWSADGNAQCNLCADTVVFHIEGITSNWFKLIQKRTVGAEEYKPEPTNQELLGLSSPTDLKKLKQQLNEQSDELLEQQKVFVISWGNEVGYSSWRATETPKQFWKRLRGLASVAIQGQEKK